MSKPSSLALALPVVLSLGVSFSACNMGAGCSKSVDRAPGSSPDDSRGNSAALPAIAVGQGVISGEVLFNGTPPAMQPLKRGVDPVCASGAAFDEQVLVRNGKLQNAVVRVLGRQDKPLPSSPAVLDQKACTFAPRVQGVVAGQSLQITNSDGILHNVHAYKEGRTIFNYAQPAQSAPRVFTSGEPGVIKLKCDVHPWMTAFVVASPSSYFAVTGPDGAFSISGLADGAYQLEAWHERFGRKTAAIKLESGAAPRVVFTYSPEDRG